MWGGPSSPASRPRTWRSASARGGDVGVGRLAEVGRVAARDDPDLERRARGERGERDRRVVLPDEPLAEPRLVADEPAERALALADHEPGRAADLLGDPVRDLGQVVQVEAQVVRPGSGLGAPVLDDLDVGGLAGGRGRGDGVAAGPEHLADDRAADRLERPVLARRGDDRPPAARRPGLLEGDLGEVPLEPTGLVLGPDDVEGEVLEGPQPDAVAGRLAAVLAVAAVVDRPRRRAGTGRGGTSGPPPSRPTSR